MGKDEAESVRVVGMGASAGGLHALEAFFSEMPSDSGMAFVVVTHLHAGQPSLLAELLGRKTRMEVVQVTEAMPVAPNRVYTCPPGHHLEIRGGVLHPMVADKQHGLYLPIDHFFRSLAQDRKEQATALVLSGTGSDGSVGIADIKAELGLVMAQEERSAQYGGMPHSAAATGLVDYVLPASEMPKQLLACAEALGPQRARSGDRAAQGPEAMQQILALVRRKTGHDFSQYKATTVNRRVERQMDLHRLDSAKHYLRYLEAHPAEIELLFHQLLIGVTSFFRDPEAWDALASAVSDLLRDKPDDYVVRAWVPACSTGEEAYSLAILLRGIMDAQKRTLAVQIFATDLDSRAIDTARAGTYPLGIANDVSPPRLAQSFTREGDTYRVRKGVREMLVFAPQNLISDPPFTQMDLVCCRNLLIYLDAKLQKKLLPMFHHSLKPGGLLFLGSSESLGSEAELFDAVEKKWKILRRAEVASASYVPIFPAGSAEPDVRDAFRRGAVVQAAGIAHLDRLAEKMLLSELVPPTVLVHERGDVVYVHGRTGRFLEPAHGQQANANIFDMAREGLQSTLSAGIRHVKLSGETFVQRGVQVQTNGSKTQVDVHVTRLQEPESLRGLYRITFTEARAVEPGPEAVDAGPPERALELERELRYTKESHQSTIEELRSTNEELQSTNEELQSANEELETSKEEMQSLNEELQTVNAELQGKVDELSEASNDMKNLLNATDIATVFLDNELRIKRYTEQATKVIHLIPSDVGRPIADLASTIHDDHLVEHAREVLRTLVFKESEIRADDTTHYLMRILPYRTTENVIDGLVLTFTDLTKLKALQREEERLREALRSAPVSIVWQDVDLRITSACNAVFGQPGSDLVGKLDGDYLSPTDAERLTEVKKQVLATGAKQHTRLDIAVEGEAKTFDLHIEPERDDSGQVVGIYSIATDVS